MASQSISAISPIEPDRSLVSSVSAAAEAPAKIEAQHPVEKQTEQSVPTASAHPAPAVPAQADVHLRFQVDEKTKDLTVFIVDRATQKVIRTIPADEVNNLQAGDLVHLLA